MNTPRDVIKALRKKMHATQWLQHVLYKFTAEDTVMINDASTYELIIMAVYFPSSHGTAHISKETDGTNTNAVQNTITVEQDDNKNYTVNVYYTTTSRLLLNGTNTHNF